jgi:hypothetical protein
MMATDEVVQATIFLEEKKHKITFDEIRAQVTVNHFEVPVEADPDMFGLWLHEIQASPFLWH